MANETVLLNSGGMDSYVLAKQLNADGYVIHSLYIDLGQDNGATAKVAAQTIADEFCDTHDVIEGYHVGNAETTSGFHGLPFQVSQLFICAASYTRGKWDLDTFYSGVRNEIFRTDGTEFVSRFLALLNAVGMFTPVTPICPLMDEEEVYPDDELISQTVSCNHAAPCGECNKCLLRIEKGVDINE